MLFLASVQRLVAPATTATMSRVRRATEAGIDEMVEMFRIQHAASALRDAAGQRPDIPPQWRRRAFSGTNEPQKC
jgi:hypothetical protein